jgi:hypothetical protein
MDTRPPSGAELDHPAPGLTAAAVARAVQTGITLKVTSSSMASL